MRIFLKILPTADATEVVDQIDHLTDGNFLKAFFRSIRWDEVLKQFLLLLLTLVLGIYLIRKSAQLCDRLMRRRRISQGARHFLTTAMQAILYFVLLVMVAGRLGLKMTGLFAIVGSLGLATGLALQGSLADLASGILLVFLHPFRAGDRVYLGQDRSQLLTVHEIRLFTTSFIDGAQYRHIVPNAKITKDAIVNLSREKSLRVRVGFQVGYGEDLARVKAALLPALRRIDHVLLDPPPSLSVAELAESGVNLNAFVSTDIEHLFSVRSDVVETLKKTLETEGIEIPYPQLQVRTYPEPDAGKKED